MQMRRVSIDDLVAGGRQVYRRGRRWARRIVRQGRRLRAARVSEQAADRPEPVQQTAGPKGSGQKRSGQRAAAEKAGAPEVSGSELATRLSELRWTDDLELSGWAYLNGIDTSHDTSELELWLEPATDIATAERVSLAVTRGRNPAVDVAAADPQHDHADGWFTATATGRRLAALAEGSWRLRIALRQGDQRAVRGFGSRDSGGSAGMLQAGRSIVRPAPVETTEASALELVWNGDDGLVLNVRRPVVIAAVQSTAAGWQLSIETSEAVPGSRIVLRADGADGIAEPGPVVETDEIAEIGLGTVDDSEHLLSRAMVGQLPEGYCGSLELITADGTHCPVGWRDSAVGRRQPLPADAELTITAEADGRWRVRRQARWAQLTEAVVDPRNRLRAAGRMHPATGWERLELVGPRETWSGAVLVDPEADGEFTAEVELVGSDDWGHQGVVPLAGVYQVVMVRHGGSAGDDAETVEVDIDPDQLVDLPREGRNDLLRWRFDRAAAGTLQMKISQPLADDERSKRRQAVLRGWSRSISDPLEDAVYFESFVGKFTSCSPGAIFAELRERRPDLRYYWGIRDHAVPVPEGGIPVLMNSREWWRVRATSRYLVTNSWVQRTFAKRPGQQVVQTWHGTPYKRLALDREGRSRAFIASTKAESATWDYLLAQSDYMAEAMVSAYGYPGEPLRSGYPRNDVIHSSAAQPIRARLRRLLGITDDQQALLYAPTWREDRTTMVDELDLGELRRRLGPEYVILARGHGNVLRRDHDHSAAGVIDVTSYPDATHLYLTADLAMTDYSSVMFDYTVTGKPLLFFVPDIDRYTSTLRGVYFDLEELAPGPLLRTLDEVVEQVRGLAEVRRTYADRYSAWQQKFDTWDDGGATGRVVDAVFGDLI